MTLAELVRDLSYHNPEWRPSDVEQRARLLREAGLLPQGRRGRASPPIGAGDIATLLVGLGATGKAVEVASTVPTYFALRPSDQPALVGAADFGTALIHVLEDNELLNSVDRINICRSWPEASIVLRRGKKGKKRRFSYLPPEGRPGRRDQIQISATIRPEILIKLSGAVIA